MTSGSDGKWTLRIGTHESGPFSLEEVRGLYQDGEILGHHHGTSARLGGRWVEIRSLFPDLAAQIDAKSSPSAQPPSDGPKIAPTRPSGDVGSALNLLETLQSVKDKQTQAPPAPAYVPPQDTDWLGVGKQLLESRLVQAGLAIFCVGMGIHLVISRWRAPDQPPAEEKPVAAASPSPVRSAAPRIAATPTPTVTVTNVPNPQITVSVPGQPSRTFPAERARPRQAVQPAWQSVEPAQPRYRGQPPRLPTRAPIDPNTLVNAEENSADGQKLQVPDEDAAQDAHGPDENGNYGGILEAPTTSPIVDEDTGGT